MLSHRPPGDRHRSTNTADVARLVRDHLRPGIAARHARDAQDQSAVAKPIPPGLPGEAFLPLLAPSPARAAERGDDVQGGAAALV